LDCGSKDILFVHSSPCPDGKKFAQGKLYETASHEHQKIKKEIKERNNKNIS